MSVHAIASLLLFGFVLCLDGCSNNPTLASPEPVNIATSDKSVTIPENGERDRYAIQGWSCIVGYIQRGSNCVKKEMQAIPTTTVPDKSVTIPENGERDRYAIQGWSCIVGYIQRGNNCVKNEVQPHTTAKSALEAVTHSAGLINSSNQAELANSFANCTALLVAYVRRGGRYGDGLGSNLADTLKVATAFLEYTLALADESNGVPLITQTLAVKDSLAKLSLEQGKNDIYYNNFLGQLEKCVSLFDQYSRDLDQLVIVNKKRIVVGADAFLRSDATKSSPGDLRSDQVSCNNSTDSEIANTKSNKQKPSNCQHDVNVVTKHASELDYKVDGLVVGSQTGTLLLGDDGQFRSQNVSINGTLTLKVSNLANEIEKRVSYVILNANKDGNKHNVYYADRDDRRFYVIKQGVTTQVPGMELGMVRA